MKPSVGTLDPQARHAEPEEVDDQHAGTRGTGRCKSQPKSDREEHGARQAAHDRQQSAKIRMKNSAIRNSWMFFNRARSSVGKDAQNTSALKNDSWTCGQLGAVTMR
jgi:hypothetical protein